MRILPPPNISGIYLITCVTTRMIYIGGARCIRIRWVSHLSTLRAGRHRNQALQAAWDTYGEQAFTFEILERCEESEIEARELEYIRAYRATDPAVGFNKTERTQRVVLPSQATTDRFEREAREAWDNQPRPTDAQIRAYRRSMGWDEEY